jgi:hypothetical protein
MLLTAAAALEAPTAAASWPCEAASACGLQAHKMLPCCLRCCHNCRMALHRHAQRRLGARFGGQAKGGAAFRLHSSLPTVTSPCASSPVLPLVMLWLLPQLPDHLGFPLPAPHVWPLLKRRLQDLQTALVAALVLTQGRSGKRACTSSKQVWCMEDDAGKLPSSLRMQLLQPPVRF